MMSPADAIIWHIEEDPHLRSTIMAVWELDQEPTAERMSDSLRRMSDAIPRLRQRVEPGRPRPRWVEMTDFDATDHFREHALGGAGSLTGVHRIAERMVRQPFDRTRPQWELALVRGVAGGRAAIVIKVHHAIADGIGLVLMLAAFTDIEPNPECQITPDNVLAFTRPRRAYGPARRALHKGHRVAAAVRSARWAALPSATATLRSAARLVWPSRTPLSRNMTARSGRYVLDTRTVDFRTFRDAGKPTGSSLNDVFVAVVVDALRRYHDRFDGPTLDRVRVHMPVDVRSARTANLAGNEFVPARVSIDVPTGDAHDRLDGVRGQLARLRSEPALHHINTIAACILRLGKRPTQLILGGMMKGVDVLASNVPGPNFALYVAGVKVERFHAFGPPAGAALNVTLFSYDGTVNLGITTDQSAITDRAVLLRCLDEAIADVLRRPVMSVAV
jgi:diacylglycerol O-acyltransferase / wax synthase